MCSTCHSVSGHWPGCPDAPLVDPEQEALDRLEQADRDYDRRRDEG